MTLCHIIFLVVFFLHFIGVQMSSQVPEAKKGQKISVEIKKNRASILSYSKGISILEKSSLDFELF